MVTLVELTIAVYSHCKGCLLDKKANFSLHSTNIHTCACTILHIYMQTHYTGVHTCTHMHTHTHAHTHTRTRTHTNARSLTHSHTHTHTHTRTHTHTHTQSEQQPLISYPSMHSIKSSIMQSIAILLYPQSNYRHLISLNMLMFYYQYTLVL